MKLVRAGQLAVVMIVCGTGIFGQAVKNFSKDGLAFNYPSGWTLQDSSSGDAQQLTLARSDSDAQIKLFVYRANVTSPERLAEAQKRLVDPYVDSTVKRFEQMGAHPERSPASTEIGGVKADGVKVRATLEGQPGAAEIYWGLIGQRLVVMTFFGPDRALKQMTSAWDTVRSSLQIEGTKPEAKPSPGPE